MAARRLALGHAVSPPPEIMFYLLARELGITPDVIGEKPADEVLRWWQLFVDLKPKEERSRGIKP
jgi:hypothetical protein